MKKSVSSSARPRTGLLGRFLATSALLVYWQTGQIVLANSSEQPTQAAPVPSQVMGGAEVPVEDPIGTSDRNSSGNSGVNPDDLALKSEELLLTDALRALKGGNLAQAVENLGRLKDTFPENDDYLFLYRTALRKKNSSDPDSQKWYSYVRRLDKQEAEKHIFLDAAKDSLNTPAKGRINELKRANWLILTTGKSKAGSAKTTNP